MHLKELAYAARQFICKINFEVLPLYKNVTILLINYICFYNYKRMVSHLMNIYHLNLNIFYFCVIAMSNVIAIHIFNDYIVTYNIKH